MRPAEKRGGAAHGVNVKRLREKVQILPLKNVRFRAVPYAVDIALPAAVQSCVKARLGKLQSGYVYHYAFVMLLGVAGLLTFAILAWGA